MRFSPTGSHGLRAIGFTALGFTVFSMAMFALRTPTANAAPTSPTASCELAKAPDATALETPSYLISLDTLSGREVGKPFAVTVTVCARDGTSYDGQLRVDADMPAHGHGMNYRVSVKPLVNGRFDVSGFLLHMPGRWRITLGLRGDAGWERTNVIVVPR